VKKETLQSIGMAGGIIGLAAIAAWMGLAHAISRVTTPIALGIVYFVVTALALLAVPPMA